MGIAKQDKICQFTLLSRPYDMHRKSLEKGLSVNKKLQKYFLSIFTEAENDCIGLEIHIFYCGFL